MIKAPIVYLATVGAFINFYVLRRILYLQIIISRYYDCFPLNIKLNIKAPATTIRQYVARVT